MVAVSSRQDSNSEKGSHPGRGEADFKFNVLYVKIIYPMGVSAMSRSSFVDSNSEQASRPGRREAKFMD